MAEYQTLHAIAERMVRLYGHAEDVSPTRVRADLGEAFPDKSHVELSDLVDDVFDMAYELSK